MSEAVTHILGRIVREPRLAYYFDPISRSLELLTEEYAREKGLDLEDFRREYEARLKFEAPRTEELSEALRIALEEIEEHHREYHHQTPPERMAAIKKALGRA